MDIILSDSQKRGLREMGVNTLYLFGSRAQGIANEMSDYDYAVLLDDPKKLCDPQKKSELYNQLYNFLCDISPRTLKNDVLDIVFLQGGVSIELQAHIIQHNIVLYDRDPRGRADYEAQVMIRMADFRPVLNIFDNAILARAAI